MSRSTVRRGEVLGLVGESGSGKSTVGRTVLRLLEPTAGSITFAGQEISRAGAAAQLQAAAAQDAARLPGPVRLAQPAHDGRADRRRAAQHPRAPHLRRRAPRAGRAGAATWSASRRATLNRYPHEFSGGQRQRIGIARALIIEPDFLVADEPVSALDVSIQAQIVNLLLAIKAELGLTILFITHDLAVVGHISDRVAVMYLGRLVELAPVRELFRNPRHPYTEALLSAAPDPDPTVRRKRILLRGDIPSPINPPSGCAFRTRCPYALPACAERVPELRDVGRGHLKACIRDELELRPAPVAA